VDNTARQWFHRLRLPDGSWALTPAFAGIHSAALREEDFAVIAAHGGSAVWSPLSNYLLYGDTLDLWAARRAGVLMGLGSDWAPSGSKNLLGELKVATLANQRKASRSRRRSWSPWPRSTARASCAGTGNWEPSSRASGPTSW
jgi:hypothetical protein